MSARPRRCPTRRLTIPVIRTLIDRFHALGRPVIYTRFIGGQERTLMWAWSPELAPPLRSCRPGVTRSYGDVDGEREGVAVIDELTPAPGDVVVDKFGYGAFHRTLLADLLETRGVDTVVVTGTVTQICVDETVRGAFDPASRPSRWRDAVSSFDPALHEATLRNLAMKFARVMPAADVLTEIGGR